MGGGSWSHEEFESYTSTKMTGKTVKEVYKNTKIKDDFDPLNIKFRESRDSDNHPTSNAIILGLDVTGSMNRVLDKIIRRLGDFMKEVLDKKPIVDPQIMSMGIGDVIYDRKPLQVTQFESDIIMVEQLSEIWLENGGGGNGWESYNLAWYFAAMKTNLDCFEKRKKKGILVTIGDEDVPADLTAQQIKKIFGDVTEGITNAQLLKMVSRTYDVYHLIIEQGSNYRGENTTNWKKLLGQNAIPIDDYKNIPEILTALLQVNAGHDKEEVIGSWDGSTAVSVKHALGDYEVAKSYNSDIVVFD